MVRDTEWAEGSDAAGAGGKALGRQLLGETGADLVMGFGRAVRYWFECWSIGPNLAKDEGVKR